MLYVSNDAGGGWMEVFYWGDGNTGNNGSILPSHYPPIMPDEADNELIPWGELYNLTGIEIGVGGTYRYILIAVPLACGDPAQIDSFEIWP